MGHVPHLLHWLFEETKLGGVAAVVGAIVAGLLINSVSPVIIDSPTCADAVVCTAKTLDAEALVQVLLGALVGGAIGVLVALGLVELGVDKETLGISDD
ncbi:MAG: hypothetical protein QOE69_2157 [Thermoleophilaceae bacterium]|nr:hypothetical protein [Thermoleophilaceae bacterium]MEA2408038.1 hypothetical protein [Thermoleophilaceae bacterium]